MILSIRLGYQTVPTINNKEITKKEETVNSDL